MTTFQIERADWTLFSSLETLSQKAGVPVRRLRRLALKEIVDNALDAGGVARLTPTADGYIIDDDGPGIDGTPEEIARLFSINRPLVSAKLWRKPSRGALGNGLRVVAGALICSRGGRLVVTTKNKRMQITPLEDGGATATCTECDFPVGTRVEIAFGPALPTDQLATSWAMWAIELAEGGKTYVGKPSVWHHDGDSFYALTKGAGRRIVRDFISGFDGCTGAKAGEIASDYLNRVCASLTREEAAALLLSARNKTESVSHRRLGCIGQIETLPECYAKSEGAEILGVEPRAHIPCVVEAWVERSDKSTIDFFVNRTPIVAELSVWRNTSKKEFIIYGCELRHMIDAPKKGEWSIYVNVTTPHMPITSDGKTPDLSHFGGAIIDAIGRAIKKTRGQSSVAGADKLTQKDVFLESVDGALDTASGHGVYRPSVRDLFYAMRPYFLDSLGIEPKYKYFETMLTDYETENGEIEGLYREERGALYHPHTREEVQLGTQEVENYERPPWLYNKIIVIEKMGMIEAMRTAGLPERYDFTPMTSRGFTTRALKDILDKMSDHDEPLTVYCVTDADGPGTMIYQTLVSETRARGARKVEIVNLGLHPWEAEAMGLQSEQLEGSKRRKAVAQFVIDHAPREDGQPWEEWLQSNRYELNAMGIPRFLEWLEGKLIEQGGGGKVVPPQDVIDGELQEKLEAKFREAITERLLRENKLDELVHMAMRATPAPLNETKFEAVTEWLARNDRNHWRDYVDGVAAKIVEERK